MHWWENQGRKTYEYMFVNQADVVNQPKTHYQYITATARVMPPVITINLADSQFFSLRFEASSPHHSQGANPVVLICNDPKLMKPEMIWAIARVKSISPTHLIESRYLLRSPRLVID